MPSQTDMRTDMVLKASYLELMLREAHHRIANSLQLISSLVALEGRSASPSVGISVFEKVQGQIEAVATVHELLSASGAKELVPLHDYLSRLVATLQLVAAGDLAFRPIRLYCEPTYVTSQAAIYLGMIVNELVTNACQHAYLPGAVGEVRVTFTTFGGSFVLCIEDDGPGMPAAGPAPGGGFGSDMTAVLAGWFDAILRCDTGARGTRVTLEGRKDAMRPVIMSEMGN